MRDLNPSRRKLLLTGGVIAGSVISGCSSRSDEGSNESNNQTTSHGLDEQNLRIGDVASTSKGEVTVSRLRTEDSIAVPSSTHMDIVGNSNNHFLIVRFQADYDSDSISCIDSENIPKLRIDGDERAPEHECLYPPAGNKAAELAYTLDDGNRIEEAEIILRTDDISEPIVWKLDRDNIQEINTRSDMTLSSVSVPSKANMGERVLTSIDVENRGNSGGTFHIKIDTPDQTTPIYDSFRIPSGYGDKRTYAFEVQSVSNASPESVDVVFDWGKDTITKKINIQ